VVHTNFGMPFANVNANIHAVKINDKRKKNEMAGDY
jgi:hypothetical protein